jgi:alkanesulfonate monooxygenase
MIATPIRFHWRMVQGGERPGASRSYQASLCESGLPDLEPQARFCTLAEEAGMDGVLVDFGWSKPDSILLSTALGLRTKRIKFIIAYRSGLMSPTTFVQQINTLSALIDGRVAVNVVAGHSPEEQRFYGDFLSHDERYARTEEFFDVCNRFWYGSGEVDFAGRHYRIEHGKLNTPYVASDGAQGPELYIAGNSAAAAKVAITQGSCWMMLADAPEAIAPKAEPVLRAGKTVGLRLSVITRPTRAEALRAAREIAASEPGGFDSKKAESGFISRSDSVGLRSTHALAERDWLTPCLWTGLVRTHGAPALALVGAPDEIADQILELKAVGITQLILSGWPKLEEMLIFGREVLPRVRQREAAALCRAAG